MRATQHGEARREQVEVADAMWGGRVLARMRALPGYNLRGAVFRAPRTGNPCTDSGFNSMRDEVMDAALAGSVVTERIAFHDLRAHYAAYYKLRFEALPDILLYMRIQCATKKIAPGRILALCILGWLMGLEPTTTGITILDSTN